MISFDCGEITLGMIIMKITNNMSALDRIIRVFVSLGCIYLGFIDHSLINDSLLAALIGGFGVFNLLVIAVGVCPVYSLAGINTANKH